MSPGGSERGVRPTGTVGRSVPTLGPTGERTGVGDGEQILPCPFTPCFRIQTCGQREVYCVRPRPSGSATDAPLRTRTRSAGSGCRGGRWDTSSSVVSGARAGDVCWRSRTGSSGPTGGRNGGVTSCHSRPERRGSRRRGGSSSSVPSSPTLDSHPSSPRRPTAVSLSIPSLPPLHPPGFTSCVSLSSQGSRVPVVSLSGTVVRSPESVSEPRRGVWCDLRSRKGPPSAPPPGLTPGLVLGVEPGGPQTPVQ